MSGTAMQPQPENRTHSNHSYLKAARGLTHAALLDGHSANKTFRIPAAVNASAALLKSKTRGRPGELVMIRESGHEIVNPSAQPRTASAVLSNKTWKKISVAVAPNARLIPISAVRSLTAIQV